MADDTSDRIFLSKLLSEHYNETVLDILGHENKVRVQHSSQKKKSSPHAHLNRDRAVHFVDQGYCRRRNIPRLPGQFTLDEICQRRCLRRQGRRQALVLHPPVGSRSKAHNYRGSGGREVGGAPFIKASLS